MTKAARRVGVTHPVANTGGLKPLVRYEYTPMCRPAGARGMLGIGLAGLYLAGP